MNKSNIESVVELVLKDLKIKANFSTISTHLGNLPADNNLLKISECLDQFNIESKGYKIAKMDYSVDIFKYPFAAHFRENNGHFVVVHQIQDGKVEYSDENTFKKIISEQKFLMLWSGVMLEFKANHKSGEANYIINRVKANSNSLFVLSILIVLVYSLGWYSWSKNFGMIFNTLLVIKAFGIGVSILLLIQNIDVNNTFIQRICSLSNTNKGCDTILKSDAAKITSWLSWSEIGFFYFTGSSIVLLSIPSFFSTLSILNFLAIPFMMYSFWYQYSHKRWCLLCSFVMALLSFELIAFLYEGKYRVNPVDLSPANLFIFLIAFLFPISFWTFLRPFFVNANKFKLVDKQFKYNEVLFYKVLTSQRQYPTDDDLMSILIGNSEADIVITMVSNPFCGPCAKAHNFLNTWIKQKDGIQLKVLFTKIAARDDQSEHINKHFTALGLLKDQKIAEEAINDWYNRKAKLYASWAEKYPVTFNSEVDALTKKQKEWFDLTEILYTPTIFINGYKLPYPYLLEDIKYLIA